MLTVKDWGAKFQGVPFSTPPRVGCCRTQHLRRFDRSCAFGDPAASETSNYKLHGYEPPPCAYLVSDVLHMAPDVPPVKTAAVFQVSDATQPNAARADNIAMSGTTDRNNAVLVADDDERLLAGLKRAIRGYHVFTAATPASALAIFESTRIDAAVVDLDLGRARGDDLVAQLRKRSPWLAIVVLTGVGSAELGALAIRAGADVVIDKPVLPPRLVEIVNEVRARPRSVSLVDARDAYIAKVIEDCDGNKSEAARRLKIERYSLRRMLSKAKRTGP